jgi:hypothetical protein
LDRFPEPDDVIQEVLASINRAIGGVHALHIGPIDYNIATTVDDLLVAIRLLEQLGQDAAQ